MNSHDQQKIAPTAEIISQLKETAQNQDNRTYNRLKKQVDWQVAKATQLDQAIGVALSFGDTKHAKRLTEFGLEHFPEHEVFSRVWPLFNPRPARVVKSSKQNPSGLLDPTPDSSIDKLQIREPHVHEYGQGFGSMLKTNQKLPQRLKLSAN